MKLNNTNIFIFIDDYRNYYRNNYSKKKSFLELLQLFLKKDFEIISFYYKDLFNFKK